MAYTHLSVIEREKIQEMRWEKRSIRAIAEKLGRAPSSISRELQKNITYLHGHYTPRTAHARAVAHRTHRGRKDRLKHPLLRAFVIEKLKTGYSPEQIAGRLPLEYPEETISHEAIYHPQVWHRQISPAKCYKIFVL